tara:strand:+ start:494 stop:601 length:108 start_codon:yes stop_codon:yes gene_type:complete
MSNTEEEIRKQFAHSRRKKIFLRAVRKNRGEEVEE